MMYLMGLQFFGHLKIKKYIISLVTLKLIGTKMREIVIEFLIVLVRVFY
jgi:hypothetical protein